MSVVSKDIVFHVKFDLEGAKKELDKKNKDSSQEQDHPQRGAPHKIEAEEKRGMSPSRALVTQSVISKHYEKERIAKSLQNSTPSPVPTGNPDDVWFKIISGPSSKRRAGGWWANKGDAVLGSMAGATVTKPSITPKGLSPRSALKSGLKHGLGVGETAEIGFMARMAGVPLIKSTLSSALGIAKIASPAVIAYELAKHAPLLSAARSTIMGGKGTVMGDLLEPTTMISQALGQVHRSYQLVKSIVFRPVAYHGYEAAMGKQGGKRGGGAFQINGTNLGTLEYDINESMDRLDYARDRGMMMRVGRAYGGKILEKMGYQPGENPMRKVQEEFGLTFKKS